MSEHDQAENIYPNEDYNINIESDYTDQEYKLLYGDSVNSDPFGYLTSDKRVDNPSEGFGIGSLSRSIASGVTAGFTGFNLYDNADERDASYEAIAYSIGHLVGLVGGVASLFTGVGTLAQGITRGSAIVGSKLLLKSATAKVSSAAVQSSLATTFGVNALKTGQAVRQFKSVPSWLTEVILKNKAKELRSVPQAIVGLGGRFGSKLGLKEQVAANITERSMHMGILMGIAAEPLQNVFDPETYGTRLQATAEGLVFGGVMGTIGNAFDKTGLTKAGKFALGFQTEKFIVDPAKRELANKSIRALSMGIFQTMSGSAFDDEAPTEMHVYNFLLGSYFGWHERSWVDTEAGKILARKKMGTTTTGALNLWKDISNNSGDIAKADPIVKERVQEFVDSMIGKITKDGETIIASHPSLVTASAFKEAYGDFVNTAATLYEKGTLSKEQFDKVILSKSLDEVYDTEMKALNKSKEEYQQIVDANPEKLNEIIDKAKGYVDRISKIRESIDYTKYINDGVDALLSQKQFQVVVDQAGIPKSVLSPLYELATFLRTGTSTASADVLFGDYVKLLANNLKENVDLELINNNGKPLTREQEVNLKLKTLEGVKKRILDEPSTKNPELIKKLTDANVVDMVFSKLLNWANSTYTKQHTFAMNEQGKITGIVEVGSIGADGKYINHHQIESNFTRVTGVEIITVGSVSNDKLRSVTNVSEHALSDSEVMKMADEAGYVFIGGVKDKEDLAFIRPLIDAHNPTNATDLAKYLEKLDPIFKERYPGLASPTTYFNSQLAKILKDIPEEKQAYYTQLYINTYLNNIKLAELRNGGVSYEEQVASGGKFLNNAAEVNKRAQIFNAREVPFNPTKYTGVHGVSFKENYIPVEITDAFLTDKINNDPSLKEGLEQKIKLETAKEVSNKSNIEFKNIETELERLEQIAAVFTKLENEPALFRTSTTSPIFKTILKLIEKITGVKNKYPNLEGGEYVKYFIELGGEWGNLMFLINDPVKLLAGIRKSVEYQRLKNSAITTQGIRGDEVISNKDLEKRIKEIYHRGEDSLHEMYSDYGHAHIRDPKDRPIREKAIYDKAELAILEIIQPKTEPTQEAKGKELGSGVDAKKADIERRRQELEKTREINEIFNVTKPIQEDSKEIKNKIEEINSLGNKIKELDKLSAKETNEDKIIELNTERLALGEQSFALRQQVVQSRQGVKNSLPILQAASEAKSKGQKLLNKLKLTAKSDEWVSSMSVSKEDFNNLNDAVKRLGVRQSEVTSNEELAKDIEIVDKINAKYDAELSLKETPTQPSTSVKSNLPGPDTKINIYAGTNENAELSNFAIRPFKSIDPSLEEEINFKSVEQAFQYFKTQSTDPKSEKDVLELGNIQDAILKTTDGGKLRVLGKSIKNFDSKNWDNHSSRLIKELIKQSFKQNPKALERLLATGNAELTHTQDKSKWGTEFPKLLMEVRNELRTTQPSTDTKVDNIAKVTADVKAKYYKELRETLLEQQKVDIATKENQAKDEQLHLDFNSELISEESLLPQFNVILYDKFTITGISEITRIDENGKTVRDDRAIDGSIHFRSDVWNTSAAERGAGDSDVMKGFVYGIGPEGALMVKPAFYKANGPEETIAISSGSHVVMHKSAVKQTGNRTLVDVEYNPETGEIAYYKSGTKETVTDPRFKLNIDAFTHNLGVGENLKELTNSAGGIPKQIGAGLSEEATNAVLNELFLPVIQGDLVENSRYSKIISTVKSISKGADPATQITNEKLLLGEIESLDISKLSPSNLINIFYGKDEVPFALYEKTAKHILHLKESQDLGELGPLEQFISYQNTALKAIQGFGLSKAMLNSSFAKPFVDAKVRGYLIDSYVSPRVRNNASSKNIILPYDMSGQTIAHELLGRHLAVGEALISEDLALAKKGTSGRTFKELLDLQKTIQQNTSKELDPLKNELTEALGIPKENLSDADKIMHENFISETTNKIKDIISKYEKEGGDLSEELSILSIRMPNITGSAVRALKVIGTNGRRGVGITYHPEDMLYMGGADVDFDTTMSFWQISKQLKDHYRARSKDFHEVDGRPKKKVELDLTPKDLDQLSYTHPLSIIDPQAQLTAHKFAVTGKNMIGAIQNDQSIVGLLQQYMPSLKGNVSSKVMAELYLNNILTDSKGNDLSPDVVAILKDFIDKKIGVKEAQALTGLQLSGVSWERQFKRNPTEYEGAVATGVAATVDAASGTPIKPYKEVAQLLHEKIMGDPVIKLVSKSGKTVKIFNYNHKIDNPSREAGARISLFSNKAYSRLALLNDVISGKIKDEDKKTGKQFSRSIHPLEAIQLVKRTLAELKTMGIFPIDKVTGELQINSVKFKALLEIDKMANIDIASLVEVGGKSFQRMKENWDGIMRSLAEAPKGSENEKLAGEFLQLVMRYPQSAKVGGSPVNSVASMMENEMTLSDLLSIHTYDKIVKDYEKVEVSDYAPGRGVAEESLQQAISYSHMRTQDLFDMASYIVVHEYAKKAFDNNISFDRLKELALASSEFKDGLSADENLRAQVKFKGKTKAPTRSESLDGLKQFRAELDASERDFFDAYLTSSLYPNLVRKNGEDIPVYQSLTEALKHDKIAPLSPEAQKVENAKLSKITAKLGVRPKKISNVSADAQLEKKRFWYRTNMNKVALLLDNVDPAMLKRFGTILKGLEDMSFEKDATPEMLKEIFPLFNKAEQNKTVNAASEFKESQKILPEIKEMEKQSLSSSEELAMRIMQSVGHNPEKVQAEAKKQFDYIQAKIKNKLSQKYNSIEELSNDVNRIMKENNITFTPAEEKLKTELVQIFTDHPSLFYEYNTMFSGITSSLPEKRGSYFSVEPGASPRFASLIDIQKFINVYKDIRLNKGKERSLRKLDFFRFMTSIGEDLDSFEQRKISFERGLVATPDGVYETPMTYLDSSIGSVAKMFDRVHSIHSIEEEVTRTYVANKVSFLNLLDPADATKLTSMAIRRLERGQGQLNPDLKAHYENKWKEVEQDYEQNFKGRVFKTKFEGGQDITGEQIIQKIQDVMVEFNRTFYTNFIRNDEKDNKYLQMDSDGFLDTNKTLEFILNENNNNRAIDLTFNGLSKLRHEIMINKLQIRVPNGDLVTLGSIADPVLKFWARNELNKKIPGGIDFSPMEFSTDHIQSYFPHNSFSKSTSNKVIKDALTEAVNKRYSSAYEEQQKINIKYRLAVANDPSIELVNNAFDQLSVEYITVADYIKLGMSNTPGHLKHRSRTEDTITEGYTEDLASYDKYITSIIKGKHNLMGVLMGNKIITDFQNKNGMGTHTSDWVKFMQLFIRDNVGLPTTFPTEWTGKGNTFISKFNPYWVFTDQAALNTISKINKMFSLKDNSIPHLVYSPEDINYIDSQTLSYSGRTASAIKLSDIVIAINSVNNTGGAKITKQETLAQNKKYIPVSFKTTIPEQEIDLIAKVVSKTARGGKVIINLSGNGIANLEARQGEADYTVFEFLTKLNTRLNKVHEVSISEVVTGGQSGIDEAATKAVIRVNANSQYNGKTSFQPIKNTVVHTNDFARTARNGNRYSDEAGFKQRFDLTKEIEKGFTDRQQQATSVQTRVREILGHRSLKAISMLEGKYQMLSLLAHPKYILGNLMGAQYNDIALAGLSPRLRANDKWLKEHVNPLRSGSDEWSEFAYKHGAIESMFSEEISQIKLQYGARGQKFIDGLSEMFKKEGNRVDIAKIQDLWSELKIVGDISKFAANIIKGSERIARQKSWFTHYIKARDIFDAKGLELPEDHPWLVTMANRGVAASQFLYNNANRPAHMRTPMGTLFTRFQLYMYNSLRLRNRAIKDAKEFGFVASTEGTDRLQRIMIADAFAMSLAALLPMSIFTSTLPPPYDGLINMSKGFFGDDKYKQRPGYGVYSLNFPYNMGGVAMPVFMRAALPPLLWLSTGNSEHISDYYIKSLFPYGILSRDALKTIDNPTMILENSLRIPIHGIHYRLKKKNDSFKLKLTESYADYEAKYIKMDKKARADKKKEEKLKETGGYVDY